MVSLVVFEGEEERELTDSLPHEDTVRSQPSESQEESFQQKPNLPTFDHGLQTLQNFEKMNFCCISHPVCVILLW